MKTRRANVFAQGGKGGGPVRVIIDRDWQC